MSPSTSTHTRRSVPASRRRTLHRHSVSSPVTPARVTAGHVTSEPAACRNVKNVKMTGNTPRTRAAMFVCDDVAQRGGRGFRFKGAADVMRRSGTTEDGVLVIYYISAYSKSVQSVF